MTRFSGRPETCQYARASFPAVSIASEPPPAVKNTFASSRGARAATRCASSSAGGFGASVADVAEPQCRRHVDVLPPGVVPDERALAADDRQRALANRAHVRERVPEGRAHGT